MEYVILTVLICIILFEVCYNIIDFMQYMICRIKRKISSKN